MRKLMATAAVALAVTLVLASTASAHAAEATTGVSLEGRGVVWAFGRGRVDLAGSGWARLAVKGDITVLDLGGDTRLRLDGALVSFDGALTLQGFRGVVCVIGSAFTLEAEGGVLLRAGGQGTITLDGLGRYRALHHRWARWSRADGEVTYPA